jgi:hypothetical protein
MSIFGPVILTNPLDTIFIDCAVDPVGPYNYSWILIPATTNASKKSGILARIYGILAVMVIRL